MADLPGPSESSHLLVNTASEEDSSPLQQRSVCISCPPSKHCCLPSKAAILILLWTIIVGATYHNFVGLSSWLITNDPHPGTILAVYAPLPYATLALIMMFYPLSGFIADVCCGRLKTVVVSLGFLLSCLILWLLGLVVFVTVPKPYDLSIVHDQGILFLILASFSLFAFIVGLVGYQANFIQLGLDQLFEAPSRYLGLFIHYSNWAFSLGSLYYSIVGYMLTCVLVDSVFTVFSTQFILPLILIPCFLCTFTI